VLVVHKTGRDVLVLSVRVKSSRVLNLSPGLRGPNGPAVLEVHKKEKGVEVLMIARWRAKLAQFPSGLPGPSGPTGLLVRVDHRREKGVQKIVLSVRQRSRTVSSSET